MESKLGAQAGGNCLILSVNREPELLKQGQMITVFPRHLIVVLLGSTNRFGEGAGLVERGWQLYDQWAASAVSPIQKIALAALLTK